MSNTLRGLVLLLASGAAGSAAAGPEQDVLLAHYAALARAEDPSFTGFDAARGRALYMGPHAGGKPDLDACKVCHTANPRATGRHYKTGRDIEPMAVSVNPERFTDLAEVEKRFSRDCPNVLGRECTARERGDYITWLSGQ